MSSTPNGRLAGKTVIVTGAGSGLGMACALMAAAEGAMVVCGDIDEKTAASTAAEANAKGGEAIAARVDIADLASTEALVAAALERYGQIDVLMQIAGIEGNGTAASVDPETWHRVIAVNLTGAWLMSRAVLPEMMRRQSGSIVLMASVSGLVGVPGIAPYAAAKGGVIALTKQMACDFAPSNIRVNAICPGTVPTPLVINSYLRRGDITPENLAEGLARTTARYPLRRHGTAEQVAALAVHLASDESGFTTGAAIPVDGGLSAVGWLVGQ